MTMSDAASELEKLRAELAATKAQLARSNAVVSASEALIAGLKLEIAMLKRDKYGRSAERTARLIDQLELQLEELETAAAEDALQHQMVRKEKTLSCGKPFLRRGKLFQVWKRICPTKNLRCLMGALLFLFCFIKVLKKSNKSFLGLPRTFVKMAKLLKMKEKIC